MRGSTPTIGVEFKDMRFHARVRPGKLPESTGEAHSALYPCGGTYANLCLLDARRAAIAPSVQRIAKSIIEIHAVQRLRGQRVGMCRKICWHMCISLRRPSEIKITKSNFSKSKIEKSKIAKFENRKFQNLKK